MPRSVGSGLGPWCWVRTRVSSVGSENSELELEIQGLWSQAWGSQGLEISRAQVWSSGFKIRI